MSYLGGKSKGAEHILDVLNDPLFDGADYVEPFVGYAHVLRRVTRKRTYSASDNNDLLICLLKAVQRGETIPSISRREYYRLKNETSSVNLRRATAAFTYSYNGKEWGGYTGPYVEGDVKREPAKERKRYYSLLADNETFSRTNIRCMQYWSIRPKRKLIYCDPPYIGTTGYGKDCFDHDRFWDVMREWSKENVVLISEYVAPSDFVCVGKRRKQVCFSGGSNSSRVERVFMHYPNAHAFMERRKTPG